MFYSIVTWTATDAWGNLPPPPTDEQKAASLAMAKTIVPDYESVLTVGFNPRQGKRIAMRTWPTAEAAQAWVDFSKAAFEGVDAVVATDPVDFTDFNMIAV